MRRVRIIGGGLAGVEAAWQCARRGVPVVLQEMRPQRTTPAHKTGFLAELVCSNSFRSDEVSTAIGLLKHEMRRLGSLVLRVAETTRVDAGGALAVARDVFAKEVTQAIGSLPEVTLLREEATTIPDDEIVVLATGPLTSDRLAASIRDFTGAESLHFYDAVAPIVEASSLDESKVFWASRYDKGGGRDYANCPFDEDEYARFIAALTSAELVPLHDFEEPRYFERCLPIEEMARRGVDTPRFGPMKPVGLDDPSTGRRPYAVVQLRRDTLAGEHLNLVGFQSRLKWGEQERVFRMIPGLAEARFVRLGQIHRNTFINAPEIVAATFQSRRDPRVLFAGQLAGVEGYVESTSSGLVAGWNAARLARGEAPVTLPRTTVIGALAHYVANAEPRHFEPAKAAFGYLPAPEIRRRTERRAAYAPRAIADLESFLEATGDEGTP